MIHKFSSLIFLNCSNDEGFTSASLFVTSIPLIIFLTAISTFLPFTVYGISLIGIIYSGTCLGLQEK